MEPIPVEILVVVKIMVPFWVPVIMRYLILTTTHVGLRFRARGLGVEVTVHGFAS